MHVWMRRFVVLAVVFLIPAPLALAQQTGEVPEAEQQLYQGGGSHTFSAGAAARGIPFELNAGKIYVRAHLNGQGPFWMILDTGSPGLVLDTATAKRLGLTVGEAAETQGAGEGGFPIAPVEEKLEARLPGLNLHEQTAAVGPLDEIVGPFEGRRIQGLLGCHNLVTNLIMEIDYAAGTLSFIDPSVYEPEGGAEAVPMENRFGHPFVKATIQPRTGEAVEGDYWVDTGMRGTLFLTTPFVEENDLRNRLDGTVWATTGGGIGGEVKCDLGRLKWVKFGGIKVKDVEVCMTNTDQGLMAQGFAAGILGSRILQRFRVAFDMQGERILFWDREGLDLNTVDYDKSGMFIISDPDRRSRIRIIDVIQGSPADEAGIVDGDVLTHIAGMPAEKLGVEKIRRRFRGPTGTSVPLVVERDGEPKRVTVVLRRVV